MLLSFIWTLFNLWCKVRKKSSHINCSHKNLMFLILRAQEAPFISILLIWQQKSLQSQTLQQVTEKIYTLSKFWWGGPLRKTTHKKLCYCCILFALKQIYCLWLYIIVLKSPRLPKEKCFQQSCFICSWSHSSLTAPHYQWQYANTMLILVH